MVAALSEGRVGLERDRVVATAFITRYGAECATVNLIIVDAAMRGRGLGRRVTAAALALAEDRECRLIATEDGLPLYEKLGFEATHAIAQHQGEATPVDAPDTVDWAGAEVLQEIVKLDGLAFGADRTTLIAALAQEGQIAVIRTGERIAGFAVLRPFGRGDVIGPVVAEDAAQARDLMAFCLAARTGEFVRIDIPECSGFASWLEERGLAHVGGGTAMTRDARPRLESTVQTFALASQALG